MKIQITFKDPDCTVSSADYPEAESVYDLPEEVQDGLARFLRYSEYVTIEFDTETGTCAVARAR